MLVVGDEVIVISESERIVGKERVKRCRYKELLKLSLRLSGTGVWLMQY